MKLGCICGSFNRSFDNGAIDQIRFLERCASQLGVQGVELQDIHFPQTRPAYLKMLRRVARDLGLIIIGVGVHNDFGRADPTLRQSEVTKVKQWTEVAEQLDAPMIRVFAGYPEGDRKERWAGMIDSLRDVAAFARHAGVRLGLENHNHGAFTPTAEEFLRVLREVDSSTLFPLLDTGNFTDGWPSIEKVVGSVEHVHAKFWQVAPDGSDEKVDYARVFPALRRAGYDKWITLEYETPEPEETGIPRALAFLKRMMA